MKNFGAIAKRVWAAVAVPIIIAAFLTSIYEWGYYRGHYAGQLHMKCAIFAVLDRMDDAADVRDDKYTFVNLGCRTDKQKRVVTK